MEYIVYILVLGIIIFLIFKLIKASKTIQTQISSINKERNSILIQKEILDILRKIGDISELKNIDQLFENFANIQELIGRLLNVEYLSIGLFNDNCIQDKGAWLPYEINDDIKDELDFVSNGNAKDTLIGSFLLSYPDDNYLYWDKNSNIDLFSFAKSKKLSVNSDFLKKYENKILKSGRIQNLLIIGLYQEFNNNKKPIGFIHIFNKFNGNFPESAQFSNEEISELLNLSKQIEISLNNFYYQINNIIERNDNNFIKLLMRDYKNDISAISKKLIEYLSIEYKSDISTLRIPIIEGFNSTTPDKIQLILKRYQITSNHYLNEIEKREIIKLIDSNKYIQINDFLDKNLLKKIKDKPKVFYTEEYNDIDAFYSNYLQNKNINIEQPLLIIPICSSDIDNHIGNWNHILGIIYMRPNVNITDSDLVRLEKISNHIGHIIASIINRNRYERIQELKKNTSELDFEDIKIIYKKITNMIRTSIGAKHTSIFMVDRPSNSLILKESTSDLYYSFDDKNKQIIKESKYIINKAIYSLNDDTSISVKVANTGKSIIINSINNKVNYSKKFIEYTDSDNEPLLFVPIKDNKDKVIGVIKCVGKNNSKSNLIDVFWDVEKELIILISSIVRSYIENIESLRKRKDFMKQIVHEILQPMQELSYELGYRKSSMSNESMYTAIDLMASIVYDLELLYIFEEDNVNYKIKKQNIIPSIVSVVNLFQQRAHAERGIHINLNIKREIEKEIWIDKERFKQVLVNILKNSIQYSYRNGRDINIYYNKITKYFEGYKNEEWHEFEFTNWGLEVNKEEIKYLFDLYSRGSNADTFHISGSGIGLYLIKKIIEGHGGLVLFKQTNHKSLTNFSIYLPVRY